MRLQLVEKQFNAAHRLWKIGHLENDLIFGKCNNPNYGHNYESY
jgi:6-pyruvoyl-tetrahydropterin synthase